MSNQPRRDPPLAGRPPFATDEEDSVYDNPPAAQPRTRQPQPPQNARSDSMYQAWDNYLHTDKDSRPNSGAGGIGMGLMNGGLDDSDDEDHPPARAPARANAPAKSSNLNPGSQRPGNGDAPRGILQTQPLARPAPAAAPGAATRQGSYDRPQYAQNGQQQQQQQDAGGSQRTGVQRPAAAQLRVDVPPPGMPRAPMPAFMNSPSPSPSLNPHPLNAPSTPITPVFARPSFQAEPERKVEFAKDAIMRGNSEETLLPRNTAKGAEFWRRFSVVAKEDPKRKKSKWLSRTMGNSRSMTRWIWCISIFLLLAIGAGIGFGWYFTHNNAPALPVAIGGSANESQLSTAAAHSTAAPTGTSRTLIAPLAVETKRSLHARRDHSDSFPAEPAKFALPTERAEHFIRHRYHRRSLEKLD